MDHYLTYNIIVTISWVVRTLCCKGLEESSCHVFVNMKPLAITSISNLLFFKHQFLQKWSQKGLNLIGCTYAQTLTSTYIPTYLDQYTAISFCLQIASIICRHGKLTGMKFLFNCSQLCFHSYWVTVTHTPTCYTCTLVTVRLSLCVTKVKPERTQIYNIYYALKLWMVSGYNVIIIAGVNNLSLHEQQQNFVLVTTNNAC